MSEKKPSPSQAKDPVPSDEELRERLTPEQYRVAREKGTERPFTGKYWETTADGTYRCVVCHEPLFQSDTKFDAGCGWPSFTAPVADEKIHLERDTSLGMIRTEVQCRKCASHLGHVFEDGPGPGGLRFCINSAVLDLDEDPDQE